MNCTKTKIMLFGSKERLARSDKPLLSLSGTFLELTQSVKFLGLSFDSTMTWHGHIDAVVSQASKRLGLLDRIRKYLSVDTCKHLHDTLVQPLYEYCDIIWSNFDKTCLDRLLRLQKRGARIILRKKIREERSEQMFRELGWNFRTCLTVLRCHKGFCPLI